MIWLRQNFYFFSQFQRVHNVRRRSRGLLCFVSRSSTLTASCTNSGSVLIRFTQLLQIFKFEVILPVFLSSNGWRNWRTTVRPLTLELSAPLIFNPTAFISSPPVVQVVSELLFTIAGSTTEMFIISFAGVIAFILKASWRYVSPVVYNSR